MIQKLVRNSLKAAWLAAACIAGSGCGDPTPEELESAAGQAAQPLVVGQFQQVRSGVATGRCLEVASNAPGNGTNVHSAACNGNAVQRWFYNSANQLQSAVDTDYCLDVTGSHTANGTNVYVWKCHTGSNQKWYQTARGELRADALGPNLCLDVAGALAAPGVNVQLWGCNGLKQQQWFTPPTLPASASISVPITISSVDLNGTGKHSLVRVQRSTSTSTNWISANVGYTVQQDSSCPGCINQVLVGLYGDSTNQAVGCVYDGVTPLSGVSGSGTVTFAAPSTPGVYYLRFRYSQAYSCDPAWWGIDYTPGAESDIAVIAVE